VADVFLCACVVLLCLRSSVKESYFPVVTWRIISTTSSSNSASFKCIFMCRVCQTASANGLIAGIQIIHAVNFLLVLVSPPPHHPSCFSPSLSPSYLLVLCTSLNRLYWVFQLRWRTCFFLGVPDVCRPPCMYISAPLDGQCTHRTS
jgi:hypothetical protein